MDSNVPNLQTKFDSTLHNLHHSVTAAQETNTQPDDIQLTRFKPEAEGAATYTVIILISDLQSLVALAY